MAIAYGQLQKTLSPFAKPPSKTKPTSLGGGVSTGGFIGTPQYKALQQQIAQQQAGVRERAAARQRVSEAPRTTGLQPYTITTQRAAPDYSGLIAGFQRAAAAARAANIARQRRIEGMYSEMMARYQPGGVFERRGLGEIEQARTKGVGTEMQQMISSGMYGTTTAAGIPRQWEAEVGAPARLRLEDVMQQRLTGIQQQKAGFLERIQEPYPDYSALMSAIMR